MTQDVAGAEDVGEIELLRDRAERLEAALAEQRESARQRSIQAELKLEAVRAGMVDLDGLKLVDPGGLEVDADGVVKGADALLKRMRREKPWLFGGTSTSSHASAPASAPLRPKLATEMGLDEWRAARAELLRRR
jgi:hypothetical protein